MPSKSPAQLKFFKAVQECKTKGKCSGKAKEVAKSMTEKQIKHFLKLKKSK